MNDYQRRRVDGLHRDALMSDYSTYWSRSDRLRNKLYHRRLSNCRDIRYYNVTFIDSVGQISWQQFVAYDEVDLKDIFGHTFGPMIYSFKHVYVEDWG